MVGRLLALILAWTAVAHADEPHLIIIGASTWWSDACRTDGRACAPDDAVPARRLEFADDDAWRVAWMAAGRFSADHIHVFTTPDDDAFEALPIAVAGPATLDAMAGAIPDDGAPVVLYIASHGDRDGLHLDDGFHDLDTVLDTLGPTVRDRLVARWSDACASGAWSRMRGVGPVGLAPPVERHAHPWVEAGVDGPTPEDAALQGGLFTHLLVSALAGAADVDRSGVIDAQELQAYLYLQSLALDHPLLPVVRSPAASSRVPDLRGSHRLTLSHVRRSRWIVSVLPGGRERVLVDAFTEPGSPVDLGLPRGTYRLRRIGYRASGGGMWIPVDGDRDARDVVLSDGPVRAEDLDAVPWGGAMRQDGGGAVADAVLASRPLRPPRSMQRVQSGYHAKQRELIVSADMGAPLLPLAETWSPWVGGAMALRGADRTGRVQGAGLVRARVALPETSSVARGWSVWVSPQLRLAWWSGRFAQLQAVIGVGGGVVGVSGRDGVRQASGMVGSDLGAGVRLGGEAWRWTSDLVWAPRVAFVAAQGARGSTWIVPDGWVWSMGVARRF